jgi:hypothetical protein
LRRRQIPKNYPSFLPPEILNLEGVKDLEGIPEYLSQRAESYSLKGARVSEHEFGEVTNTLET